MLPDEQLQFEFGDGFAAAVRGDPAAVELDLDAGVRDRVELPDGAAKVGFEDGARRPAILSRCSQLAQARLVDAGKIEVVEIGRLPLRPAVRPPSDSPWRLTICCHEHAVLAQAQQDPARRRAMRPVS
jgi:hypothetical protein